MILAELVLFCFKLTLFLSNEFKSHSRVVESIATT